MSVTIPNAELAPKKSAGMLLAGIIVTVLGSIALQAAQQAATAAAQRQALADALAELSGSSAPAISSTSTGFVVASVLLLVGFVFLAIGAVRLARAVDYLALMKHIDIHTPDDATEPLA